LELKDPVPQLKTAALNKHFPEAKTKEALKILLMQRFSEWLDDVLAEEQPLEGVAAELLDELRDGRVSDAVGPEAGAYDLHSTWSALTALTQEIKLQGRAFKQLREKMAPLEGLESAIEKILANHREALSEARRIAEEGRQDRNEREAELRRAERSRTRHELIGVIIEIRDSLVIGLRSAAESHGKLTENKSWNRLKKFFTNKSTDQNHKLEIVNSLKKGYRMGLDRIDEALQQLGVTEIICEGRPFDPRLMNAADIEENGDVPDGTVLAVYRTGYMIDNEVLRTAQVKVAHAPGQN
jgi:molecular chaperone GrpE